MAPSLPILPPSSRALPAEYEMLRAQREEAAHLLEERFPKNAGPGGRKPAWLKVRAPGGHNYVRLKSLMRGQGLHTVCEEAGCPNIGECWQAGTATFMILGEICTRACRYCAVTTGKPESVDEDEPRRLAEAVEALRLRHVVITSVNRDDLPDGGAHIFAAAIREVRARVPDCSVEVLTPDFKGDLDAVATVVEARPDVFNHNLETVESLYRFVRPGGRYRRALAVLEGAKRLDPELLTKSGIILGMGEPWEELVRAMRDLRSVGVQILTLGQYLRPSPWHLPIDRYYTPGEFAELRQIGRSLGFQHVEAGPLVRSSYHAREQVEEIAGGPVGTQTSVTPA